jgi:pimeloyl-ACP methyl ester carboxylesterase
MPDIDPVPLPTALEPPPAPNTVPVTSAAPGRKAADRQRTGVVWVHGIGTQAPRDSLFDWTRPIIEVFGEWRREYDIANPDSTIGENPVDSASVSDPENAWIEVDIPAYRGRPRGQWIFTEAYWAGDVRPPSFATAASYLLGRLPTIIRGITQGYGLRETRRMKRLSDLRRDFAGDPRLPELELAFSKRWQVTDFLDGLWQKPVVRWTLMLVATGVALLALATYSALHAIPIPALRRRIEVAAADTFIVQWFGDLPVLLDDQSQSAAIRTRLLERVAWLRQQGCDEIVLLAHSGGTILSYATLLRYPAAELPVTKLITLGEAIKLGWKLEQDVGDWFPGNSVRGDLKAGHRDLRWVDVWASYDPAPGGQMEGTPGSPLIAVEKLSPTPPADGPIEVESRPVTNFMHLGLDHGGYWANDEGFLIPVIRHIDDPRGDGSASRFFSDGLDRTLRTERRRRRVALLLAWRWTALGAALVALAGLVLGATDAAATGGWVGAAWNLVPGSELVGGTINGFGHLVEVVLTAVGADALAARLGEIGPSILGGLVPLAAIWIIYSRGVKSWFTHDRLERRVIRREQIGPAGLASARSECALVSGGLVAIIVAAWTGSLAWVVLTILATAIVAALVRLSGQRPPTESAVAQAAELSGAPR